MKQYIETVLSILSDVDFFNECELHFLQTVDDTLEYFGFDKDGEWYFNHCKYNADKNVLVFEGYNGLYTGWDIERVLTETQKHLLNKYVAFVTCR